MNIFDRLEILRKKADELQPGSELSEIIDMLIDECLEVHQLGVRILNLNITRYEDKLKNISGEAPGTSLDK